MAKATTYQPRSVEAMQLTFDPSQEEGKRSNGPEIAEWCGGTFTTVQRDGQPVPQVVVNASTGTRVANVGDYVVEVGEDNYTVMSEKEFEQKYEK